MSFFFVVKSLFCAKILKNNKEKDSTKREGELNQITRKRSSSFVYLRSSELIYELQFMDITFFYS